MTRLFGSCPNDARTPVSLARVGHGPAKGHVRRGYLHGDLFLMAAAYAFHIAENQPFLDGNKRAGLLAALTFLDLNESPINVPSDRFYDAMIAVARNQLDKAGLADLLRELVHS